MYKTVGMAFIIFAKIDIYACFTNRTVIKNPCDAVGCVQGFVVGGVEELDVEISHDGFDLGFGAVDTCVVVFFRCEFAFYLDVEFDLGLGA